MAQEKKIFFDFRRRPLENIKKTKVRCKVKERHSPFFFIIGIKRSAHSRIHTHTCNRASIRTRTHTRLILMSLSHSRSTLAAHSRSHSFFFFFFYIWPLLTVSLPCLRSSFNALNSN